jgi:hypothetical protein
MNFANFAEAQKNHEFCEFFGSANKIMNFANFAEAQKNNEFCEFCGSAKKS